MRSPWDVQAVVVKRSCTLTWFKSRCGGWEASPREGYAGAALLCEHKRDADRYATLLRARKIPYFEIKNYTGRRVDGIKIGTFVAAKGLEFKQVYLPNHDTGLHAPTGGSTPNVDERALARHRLYVAMTRARDLLWLGSVRSAT